MANVARVEATITAQNKLRPGLAAASRDLERFRHTQTRASAAIGSAMARMAATAAAGFGGFSAINGVKEATKRFAEVDRAMARTGITGDATVDQTRRGTEELRNLARDTATLFDPAQKGLDAITASGREFTDAMKMMPAVMRTAQASGSGVEEIANSSTALLDHMKISIEGLAEAQDTLAMGGKLGKFELKDMARYLPSMLPAYKAIGKTGQEGLRNLVAMLQVIRGGTGTAEEAAASAQNIFSKMESDETVKNFKEMGVDLPKAMAKARKEGKDLTDVFIELSNKALKGDLSKVPQLFKDMEVQRGMRPLLAGMQKMLEMREQLKGSKGTIDKDFLRISADTQATLDRFSEAADRAKSSLGALAAEAASPILQTGASNIDALAQALERAAEAARKGGAGAAVKSAVGDLVQAVGNDLTESRKSFAEVGERSADEQKLNGIANPDQGGWFDWLIGDTSRGATAEALSKLEQKAKKQPLSYFDKVNMERFRKELSGYDDAWSRDQIRRTGPLPEPTLTSSSPEFDGVHEVGREARRGAAFPSSKRGPVLPPVRPQGLGLATFPVQPLDDVRTKTQAAASSFDLLGPAAQNAGSQISSGLGVAMTELQQLEAAIGRVAQRLASLKAPSLGLGGFNTGKSMGEVQ